jgi:hypothetical protein
MGRLTSEEVTIPCVGGMLLGSGRRDMGYALPSLVLFILLNWLTFRSFVRMLTKGFGQLTGGECSQEY